MPNATWRRRGVATASRGVSPSLQWREAEWKGRSAAEVCTSEARKIGEWLAGAGGAGPLASWLLLVSAGGALWGVDRPAVVGVGGPKGRSREDIFLRIIWSLIRDALAYLMRGVSSFSDL
jgi:hypothetical protein